MLGLPGLKFPESLQLYLHVLHHCM